MTGGQAASLDLRQLPQAGAGAGVPSRDRVEERHGPRVTVTEPQGHSAPVGAGQADGPLAPAPGTIENFEGMHFTETCGAVQCGDGHPPDTNGDVGPVYYLQTINVAVAVYNKATGTRVAAFALNDLMSQGNFGNLCDTDNFGDPVVLYDSFHDRWIVTDFAFQVDGSGNVLSPPGSFQCFAVSMNGNPVSGGWNFYSLPVSDALQDYPKFGIWPDGLYMSANMFDFAAGGSFKNVRVWALNLAQMEAGAGSVQVVSFNVPKVQQQIAFSLLPSNARAQTGAPPAGRPNLFAGLVMTSTSVFVDRLRIWKFHVDWANTANSTFGSPATSTTSSTWALPPNEVPSGSGGNTIDTLGFRPMMQNQYANIGGVESLWDTHTVRGSSASQAAVRWYQIPVTGGTVGAALQASTWNPGSANRFMPSLAVNRLGDMAIGYSVSSSSLKPAIRYAGRLAGDPVNTLTLTETTLIAGAGTQTGNCGGEPCHRWGDYSAMTLDPDGCTFWYTNEYYAADGLDHHTRIGSFKYSGCTPLPPPSPSPVPTLSPSPTPTATPTHTPSPTPTASATPTPTASATASPTPTGTPTDTTPPTVTKPVTVVALNQQLGTSSIPLQVSWSAADPSGISSYQLQQSKDGGAWSTVTLNTPTQTLITLTRYPSHTYRFRVRATDGNSNTSAFAAGPTFSLMAAQETSATIAFSGTWTQAASSSAYGGGLKFATSSAATATFTFTGRAVAWVAPRNTNSGTADIYVDGVYKATVDLSAALLQPRMTVFTRKWSTSSAHTLQIRVKGTGRVDVDTFLLLQ